MYQHGKRLGELQPLQNLDFVEIGALQAMSLLTAINALSLVNAKDAWVEYVAPPTKDTVSSPTVRLFLSHILYFQQLKGPQHVPEEYFASTGISLHVISLSEMRREYTLLMSKLQLARDFPELPSKFYPFPM